MGLGMFLLGFILYGGEGNGNPLQYSCLKEAEYCLLDGGAMGLQRVGHNCIFSSTYPVWNSLGFLDLGGCIFSHFREVFN